MPLYEYQPVNLAQSNTCCFFETLQKHSEATLTTCPTCGSQITRAISAFSMGKSTDNSPNTTNTAPHPQFAAPAPTSSAQRIAKLANTHTCSANCRCNC